MTVAKFNAAAMEQCRTAVSTQAGHFGSAGDGFGGNTVDASTFGRLPSSAGLATAVASLNGVAKTEFAAAESLLRKIERALDAVQRSVQDNEDANKRQMTPSA